MRVTLVFCVERLGCEVKEEHVTIGLVWINLGIVRHIASDDSDSASRHSRAVEL